MNFLFTFFAGMTAGIFGFYETFGLLFVLGLAIATVAEITFLEYEKGWGASITMAVTAMVGLWVVRHHIVFGDVMAQWRWILGSVVGYLVVGTIWSIVKWHFYTADLRDRYNMLRATFCLNNKLGVNDAWTSVNKSDWQALVERKLTNYGARSIPPDPQEHKSTIMMWTGHWPFSMIWFMINDPVKRVLQFIYRHVRQVYYLVANRNFKGVAGDFN